MFENLGRKLKIRVKVKVLAKPYRVFKGMDMHLPMLPKEIVGKDCVVTTAVQYWNMGFSPTVGVECEGKFHMVDVINLRLTS